jgi:hypothetical protein
MDNAFSVDQKPNATGSDVSRGEPNGATAHTAEAVDEVAQEWNEGSRAEPRRARRKQEPTERQAQPNFHHEAREEHEEEPFLLSFSKIRVLRALKKFSQKRASLRYCTAKGREDAKRILPLEVRPTKR